MRMPRSRDGWTLLIVAVLLASTVVTGIFAAVLTQLVFPDGFLIRVPSPDPSSVGGTASPGQESPTATAAAFGWRASISCSVDLSELDGRFEPRP